MIGRIIIMYEGLPLQAPGIAQREINDIVRGAWYRVGEMWHRRFRPIHFTDKGARRYGYTPRESIPPHQFKAILHRFRQRGERVPEDLPGRGYRGSWTLTPLDASGESKALTEIRDFRATATRNRSGVRVVMHARKFNFRPPGSSINMQEEMTTVTEAEREQLLRRLQRLLDLGLAQNRRRSQVTV